MDHPKAFFGIKERPPAMLGWTFTAEQRQVLAYLFWETFGAEASRNRKGRAQHRAVVEPQE